MIVATLNCQFHDKEQFNRFLGRLAAHGIIELDYEARPDAMMGLALINREPRIELQWEPSLNPPLDSRGQLAGGDR